jgi:hypothetical protein
LAKAEPLVHSFRPGSLWPNQEPCPSCSSWRLLQSAILPRHTVVLFASACGMVVSWYLVMFCFTPSDLPLHRSTLIRYRMCHALGSWACFGQRGPRGHWLLQAIGSMRGLFWPQYFGTRSCLGYHFGSQSAAGLRRPSASKQHGPLLGNIRCPGEPLLVDIAPYDPAHIAVCRHRAGCRGPPQTPKASWVGLTLSGPFWEALWSPF